MPRDNETLLDDPWLDGRDKSSNSNRTRFGIACSLRPHLCEYVWTPSGQPGGVLLSVTLRQGQYPVPFRTRSSSPDGP